MNYYNNEFTKIRVIGNTKRLTLQMLSLTEQWFWNLVNVYNIVEGYDVDMPEKLFLRIKDSKEQGRELCIRVRQ